MFRGAATAKEPKSTEARTVEVFMLSFVLLFGCWFAEKLVVGAGKQDGVAVGSWSCEGEESAEND